jgi:hypothetical protein
MSSIPYNFHIKRSTTTTNMNLTLKSIDVHKLNSYTRGRSRVHRSQGRWEVEGAAKDEGEVEGTLESRTKGRSRTPPETRGRSWAPPEIDDGEVKAGRR